MFASCASATTVAFLTAAPLPAPDAPETADHVTVPVKGVTPGSYLVRIQVDGAESVLRPGANGRYDAPHVLIS